MNPSPPLRYDPEQLPLHELQLPDPITWWPPAPLWWLLLALLLVGGVLLWLLFGRLRSGWRPLLHRRRLRHRALAQLHQLAQEYHHHGDAASYVRQLSILLRRTALALAPRRQVAGLTGEAWLAFLDQPLAATPEQGGFCHGVGRVLLEAPYNPHCTPDVPALAALAEVWVEAASRSDFSPTSQCATPPEGARSLA